MDIKIVVIGVGEVGYNLVKALSKEAFASAFSVNWTLKRSVNKRIVTNFFIIFPQ